MNRGDLLARQPRRRDHQRDAGRGAVLDRRRSTFGTGKIDRHIDLFRPLAHQRDAQRRYAGDHAGILSQGRVGWILDCRGNRHVGILAAQRYQAAAHATTRSVNGDFH